MPGLGHYYPPSELSIVPEVVVEPMLGHSAESDLLLTGTVVVLVYIGSDGSVDKVEPDREASELPEHYQSAAADAFRTARFSPAQIEGRTVGSVLRIEVNFGSPIVAD